VEFEQGGKAKAEYGEELLKRLGKDLSNQHGRGFGWRNVFRMRSFYLQWEIAPTASGRLQARARGTAPKVPGVEKLSAAPTILQPVLSQGLPLSLTDALVDLFPLPWSHYVRLLSVENPAARVFYETEALKAGWSLRQLDRQVSTQFYERVTHSKQPATLLARGQLAKPEDLVTAEEEIRDPYLLEFLNLKDEYSEDDLEEALIRHLEWFMMELGIGFSFVARQKRILIDHVWYRMDLVFFHRLLRALVIVDLKIGEFTPADAGQMNLYLNYAKEHRMMPGEAEPVGIILCSDKNDAVVKYATAGINAKVFASCYLANLPGEEELRQEILRTKRALESRAADPEKTQDQEQGLIRKGEAGNPCFSWMRASEADRAGSLRRLSSPPREGKQHWAVRVLAARPTASRCRTRLRRRG
jgi:predicted nuclease of restriction endonuclease-like (RecB) superfamily